ncbi:phosphonate C-P lyase system protein PhnG [Izhakiella australiensis]|uniref:Phosphonate C-P lyase system protein PhnG n=1 Tax=Izhakiella australiensis TaxID=1926881 RepID=A0A1S8YLP8_9GAMM|nr:phosphonate C-P lyase system protein PhnG [Izhakiella australiensis]OON39787.1 phosphonate C-P lyase system protein PhnG [Izhakiella australiensis]
MEPVKNRQHWMSVLAHSAPERLRHYWQPLNIKANYQPLRAPEIGLTRLQARMGGSGRRFILGDATVTRAVIRLDDGTCGYSYVLGRDKAHAELCALLDGLLQQQGESTLLYRQLIVPLAAERAEQQSQRAREIASSRVDFFTLVRGDN